MRRHNGQTPESDVIALEQFQCLLYPHTTGTPVHGWPSEILNKRRPIDTGANADFARKKEINPLLREHDGIRLYPKSNFESDVVCGAPNAIEKGLYILLAVREWFSACQLDGHVAMSLSFRHLSELSCDTHGQINVQGTSLSTS